MKNNTNLVNCENCPSFSKSIFCKLNSKGCEAIEDKKTLNSYKKGQSLFVQGAPNYGAFCIRRGKVKVTKLGLGGKETIVQIASGGEFLGYKNMFLKENNNVGVVALEDTELCFFSYKNVLESIKSYPEISYQLMSKISKDLSDSEEKITSLSQFSVRERLSNLLISLKKNYGVKVDGKWMLKIALSREEMASMIGVTTETLVRFLSELKREGIISQSGKTLYLTSESEIRRFSGLREVVQNIEQESFYVA